MLIPFRRPVIGSSFGQVSETRAWIAPQGLNRRSRFPLRAVGGAPGVRLAAFIGNFGNYLSRHIRARAFLERASHAGMGGYAMPLGEASWPPLALLPVIWHNRSDARLAEVLEDRASFRRFTIAPVPPPALTISCPGAVLRAEAVAPVVRGTLAHRCRYPGGARAGTCRAPGPIRESCPVNRKIVLDTATGRQHFPNRP